MATNSKKPSGKIAICMGSQSDWRTMQNAAAMLDDLRAAYEVKIISAHRTPARLTAFAKSADRAGFSVIIAGAGGCRTSAWHDGGQYAFTGFGRAY